MAKRDRIMPHDLDLEKAILGAIILDKTALNISLHLIKREHFYSDYHAIIFDAIEKLYKKKLSADMLTITNELKRVGKLELIGGPVYIARLTNGISSASNLESHISIIIQKFIRRRTIEISAQASEEAYDDYKDPYEALDSFIKESKELYSHINFSSDASSSDVINDIMDGSPIKGRSTGIKLLDEYLIALQAGLKYTIGGRTSMGKTSLLTTLAVNLIQQGSPGIIFSMEMTARQLMTNIISCITEIDSIKIRTQKLTDAEKQLIYDKTKAISMDLLIIDGKASITDGYMWKRVKKLVKDKGIEWFGVDYTQVGKLDEGKGKQKEERIGDFSIAIKEVAKSEDVIAIELSQINRGSEKSESKRPSLADLKDSGAIEASADVALLLYRPEYYGNKTFGPNKEDTKGVAEVIVAKQRVGPTGSVLLNYKPEFSKFVDRQKIVHEEVFEPLDEAEMEF